jgi:hypothetical protein
MSHVWEKPRYDSFPIGYLRAGSRVRRAETPTEGPDVQKTGGKWYRIEPFGYMCDGKDGVTKDLDDRTAVAAAQYGPKDAPLPYGYGMAYGNHNYARVPTKAEQKELEGDVEGWRKTAQRWRDNAPPEKRPPETALAIEAMPTFLDDHAQAPAILPWLKGFKQIKAGYTTGQTRLAFSAAFDVEGRPFYLTSEFLVVPADRFKAARLTGFHGVELGGETRLPMVWVRQMPHPKVTPVVAYKQEGDTVAKTEIKLPFQWRGFIGTDPVEIRGTRYHVLKEPLAQDGAKYLVRAGDATRLDVVKPPEQVKTGEVWVDVDLGRQTLVVYRGTEPLFATLVSTGAGGKKRSTPMGIFRVYQKHWSTKMSATEKPAEEEGEQPERAYRYDDVPWVQYVYQGIALHAAFWHEGFGMPRSHGCINLSPHDARFVFSKTLPALPPGWHGLNAGRGGVPSGTLVVIHG